MTEQRGEDMQAVHEGDDVFVAMLLPFPDGSGKHVVLGVYSDERAAQARCWRALQTIGYDQPNVVLNRPLDYDYDNEGDGGVESER